jgi:hypothetical protein
MEMFFSFTVKGTVLPNHVFFATCCGSPLYGPVGYSKMRQITESDFTLRAPLFNKVFKLLNVQILSGKKVREPLVLLHSNNQLVTLSL